MLKDRQGTAGSGLEPAGTSLSRQAERRREAIFNLARSIEALPSSTNIPFHLLELRRSSTAGAKDFAEVLSADASLCSRVLALANSAWFSPSREITKIPDAIALIGLGHLLPVVFAHSMSAMYSPLSLGQEEVNEFWQLSLFKAVAAREHARLFARSRADEAFIAGLFQDIALPLVRAVDRASWPETVVALERDDRTRRERETVINGIDHAALGRYLAERLALPSLFQITIAHHHQAEALEDALDDSALCGAVLFAGALPHRLDMWRRTSLQRLHTVFTPPGAGQCTVEQLFDSIDREFERLHGMFAHGAAAGVGFRQFMQEATREITRCLEATIGESSQLAMTFEEREAQLKTDLDELGRQARAAVFDELTGLRNRRGFVTDAKDFLIDAREAGRGVGIGFVDIDDFKSINDTHGHDIGDHALSAVANTLAAGLGEHAVTGRLGGDEFAFIVSAGAEGDAGALARRIADRLSRIQIVTPCGKTLALTTSAGLLWVGLPRAEHEFEALLKLADDFMYRAKKSGKARCAVGRLDDSTAAKVTRDAVA